ncbi:nephrin-like [Limulus polyphemus]|uniref:Nephrin-like n=1 Tax=Limulus polyphemus TaxID=6850 RepID=A0ABM1T728_LIMPO|nr:nephrin-like [Limulus polyphemus]XP_022251684.1 nephrin-like [Limulus polyphemus]
MVLSRNFKSFLGGVLCLSLLWSHTASIWLKQKPANNEQPFASIVYTAVEQGRVALPCDISPPAVNDSAALVLWYKNESTQPVYMLDARRGVLKEAHQWSSPQLQFRAHFHMINRPAFLQIDPVRKGDAGTYRCRVDYRRGRSINTVIKLQVVEPPSKVLILDERNTTLSGLVGPYSEGQPLKLTCISYGGKPRPAVSWWKGNNLLDNNYSFLPHKMVENVLYIPALWRYDLLMNLTCKSSNNNVTVPLSSTVTLDLYLKPEIVEIEPFKIPVAVETEVEFQCVATGARPTALITWWLGNQKLQSSTNTQNNKSHSSSLLTYTPSMEDDRKYFMCNAENPKIPGSSINTGWFLMVNYPPELFLQLDKQGDVREGEEVKFECKVQASPLVKDVTWEFDRKEFSLSPAAAASTTYNRTLVIHEASRAHRGRYRCSASNPEGLGFSNEIYMTVKYAPTCRDQRRSYGVAIGETVRVSCTLDADPQDIAFRWRLTTSAKRFEDIDYISNQSQSFAIYVPKTRNDYGTMECWGANSAGVQKASCSFNIVPAGPPESVKNCSVLNQTEQTIFVQCLQGYDGGLPQSFTIEAYSLENGNMLANITISTEPQFSVSQLPVNTAIRFLVLASNARGRSPPAVLTAHTLRSPEKLTVRGNGGNKAVLAPVLAALIIVAIVLVVAPITGIIAFRIQKQNKRQVSRQRENDCDMSDVVCDKRGDVASGHSDKGPDIIPDQMFREGLVDCEEQCLQLLTSTKNSHRDIFREESVVSGDRKINVTGSLNEFGQPRNNRELMKEDDSSGFQSTLYAKRHQVSVEGSWKSTDQKSQAGSSEEMLIARNIHESAV